MVPYDGKYVTSYLMATVIYTISVTNYEIFTDKIQCQKFNLDNEGRGQKHQKRDHVTDLMHDRQ